ncbi:hypothetical protein Fot_33021 [Forsythia ovata]|uniref:Uncharacterized protein n=1 Tax=Forsythia ovata TaxID=205694 RepID=A0ABD1T9G9_9LAMI
MKEEIISEEIARARDNHTQQRYNHGGHMNTKPSDGGIHQQTGNRQGTYHRPFPGTGSSYAAEITETIPNLHAGINVPNQGMSTGEACSSKSKKLFTGPYCAYNRFYRHRTEDCRDIQTLAEQKT